MTLDDSSDSGLGATESKDDIFETVFEIPPFDESVSEVVKLEASDTDLEQSAVRFDQIILEDLVADYNKQLDTMVINGTGTTGQLAGLLNVSGANGCRPTVA